MPGQYHEAVGLLQFPILLRPTVSSAHTTNASAPMPLWRNKEDSDLFCG